jgi:hypothetical protein
MTSIPGYLYCHYVLRRPLRCPYHFWNGLYRLDKPRSTSEPEVRSCQALQNVIAMFTLGLPLAQQCVEPPRNLRYQLRHT